MNLCSSAVNSLRLFCSKKDGGICSYLSFLVYKSLLKEFFALFDIKLDKKVHTHNCKKSGENVYLIKALGIILF